MGEPPRDPADPGGDLLARALRLAREAHEGPRRSADTDLAHPLAAARMLRDAGFDDEVVAAGLLHDVVEDSDVALDEVRTICGDRVATLVGALTEDPTIERYERRKADHRARVRDAGRDAGALFVADKLTKAHALIAAGRVPAPRKLDHYRRSLAMLEETFPDLPMLGALAEALGRLEDAQARQ